MQVISLHEVIKNFYHFLGAQFKKNPKHNQS